MKSNPSPCLWFGISAVTEKSICLSRGPMPLPLRCPCALYHPDPENFDHADAWDEHLLIDSPHDQETMRPSMTPAAQFRDEILQPNLDLVLPIIEIPHSLEAEALLLAIAGQESNWEWRYQLKPRGPEAEGAYPARGWWQFEQRGGVAGVMRHQASAERARDLCDACRVYWDSDDVWRAMEGNDALATGFARLLLWTDSRPLPTTRHSAWLYYLDNWRPGKPHPSAWAENWEQAREAVR